MFQDYSANYIAELNHALSWQNTNGFEKQILCVQKVFWSRQFVDVYTCGQKLDCLGSSYKHAVSSTMHCTEYNSVAAHCCS